MRIILICLRRSLLLAALLGVGLVGLRWAALAVNRTETEGAGIAKTGAWPAVKVAIWANSQQDDRTPGRQAVPPGNPGADVDPNQPAEAAPDLPPPAPKPAGNQIDLLQEIGLQETLDRLGYTVNVPTDYAGHTLNRWNDYRISTADDSLPAERFHGDQSTFSMLGQQAMCAPSTFVGAIDTEGRTTELFHPDPNSSGMWLNATTPRSATVNVHGTFRLFIQDTSHRMGVGTLYSTAQNNYDRSAHLLVLPALVGGTWIDEGNNRGHWSGGKSRGYLLCWEDWNDFDYQDIVILATQIEPEWPESVAKI
jgi:hypothetical protein